MANKAIRSSSVPITREQLMEHIGRYVRDAIASAKGQWWHEHAGKFEGDAAFSEIIRLGREQRNGGKNSGKNKRARPRH